MYNESLKNEDEQFQELNKKIPLKKVLSYDEEGGMATSQEEKPQKVEIKKIKNPAFENIQGNYVEFMSNKNDFDFKKFIESLDPEIKNTNKQKVILFFISLILKKIRLKKSLKIL